MAGELVGINTAVLAQDASTEGIGFAIPVDLVRGVVEEIKQHDIYEGGPADAADLRVGDIIIEIDGERIYSQRQALLLVTAAKPGDELELVGLRDGQEFRTTIVAAERPGAPD